MSCHNLDRNRLITLIIGNAFWQTLFVILSILEAVLYHLIVIIYFFYHKQYTVSFLTTNILSRRLKNLILWWKISLRGPLFKHLSLQWIIGPMRSISNLNGLYIHIHIFCFVGELKKGIESRKYMYLLLQGKNFWCSSLMDISHAWDIGLSVDQFILYYTSNFLRLYLFIHIQKKYCSL